MTFTGTQFRDFAVSKAGFRYDTLNPWRLTGERGYFDCSGLMYWAGQQCGITMPTVSSEQARWCHAAHLDRMSLTDALKTPGCLLFEGANFGYDGWGPEGHVCTTMGDGRNVMEAQGHQRGCLVFNAIGRPWSNATHIPGINYGSGATTAPPPTEGTVGLNDVVSVYTDEHGNTWGLTPTGAVYTLTGDQFYGAYGNLRDVHGHALPARTDLMHITARWDQRPGVDRKPGYTLWSSHYRKDEHYDFGPDHPGRLARGMADLREAIDAGMPSTLQELADPDLGRH